MVSEFTSILEILSDEQQPLAEPLLAQLSVPTREECATFAYYWQNMGAERRRALAERMVELAEESFELDFTALFRVCLNDSDPWVRRQAIEGLWEDESLSLIEPLLRLLAEDPDVEVRAAAATSLGRYIYLAECEDLDERRAARVRQALERACTDPAQPPQVARRAIEALAHINDERVRELIDHAYEQGDGPLRESAVFAMGRNADPVWAETVLEELHSGSAAMRYEAARACGEMQLKRAVGPLIKMGQDPDHEVQGMVIWSLGQIGGERAHVALQRWAESDDEVMSEAAHAALDEIEFAVRPFELLVHEQEADGYTEVELADEADDTPPVDANDDWDDDVLDL